MRNNRGDSVWIRIQQQPTVEYVGYMDLDLTLVDRVKVSALADPSEEVKVAEIVYAGVMKPIVLKGLEASEFARVWDRYQIENGRLGWDTKRPPVGHIILPSN